MDTPVTVMVGCNARHACTDADVGVVALEAMVDPVVAGPTGTVTVEEVLTPSLPPPHPNNADVTSAVRPSLNSVRFIFLTSL
jgi:hypothetical protein